MENMWNIELSVGDFCETTETAARDKIRNPCFVFFLACE